MTTLLHVNASPRQQLSSSLSIATSFLDASRAARPDLKVDTLDLFDTDLPEFGRTAAAAKMAVFSGQEPTAEQKDLWDRARTVFDRFAAADEYLFNIPMWNAGVPYVLKHWIDVITQPGWVFGFDPAVGYSGLITGRRAHVMYTSGVYAPGVPIGFGADFHSTFFDDWLRFVGITDVRSVRLTAHALSPDPEGDLERARAQAADLGARAASVTAHG